MEGMRAQDIIVLLFVLSGLIAYALYGPRPGRIGQAADGPDDESYRVYTHAFDLELDAGEVAEALPGASLDQANGHLLSDPKLWNSLVERTDALLAANDGLVADRLPALRAAAGGLDPGEIAIALLIDQSGSMKGEPIAHAAAAADLFARLASGLGARSEVLGFSTAGWRGGHARAAWKRAGRPKRPGRLCALMHVVYKPADAPALGEAPRRLIVHPDLLRENVDGEAVLWAQRRLDAFPERHKLLLVLSDGAPVDDATLHANGPSILHRHIIKVVREAEATKGLTIGAVGINHRVEAYYPLSESVTALDDLPAATVRVLERMLAAAVEKIAVKVG
jgi:cobaltochelatase CobT